MALYIFGIEFLDMTPKEQTTNEKINKLYFIKIKNCCVSRDITKKVE